MPLHRELSRSYLYHQLLIKEHAPCIYRKKKKKERKNRKEIPKERFLKPSRFYFSSFSLFFVSLGNKNNIKSKLQEGTACQEKRKITVDTTKRWRQ